MHRGCLTPPPLSKPNWSTPNSISSSNSSLRRRHRRRLRHPFCHTPWLIQSPLNYREKFSIFIFLKSNLLRRKSRPGWMVSSLTRVSFPEPHHRTQVSRMNEWKDIYCKWMKTECSQWDTKGRYGFDTKYNKSLPPKRSVISKVINIITITVSSYRANVSINKYINSRIKLCFMS